MDLAYLGLAATDPLADPATRTPSVAVRPGLDLGDGFDRPLTWAVPTDAGKMADTQSPTGFTSPSPDRRGGLLEINVAPERQPTFTLPAFVWQLPAPAGDAAPVSQARAVGAADAGEPLAVAASSSPALPAFLTSPAPRLPADGETPKADPATASQPSSSYFSGPTPGGKYVGTMQVMEVDFRDNILVQADPGRTKYPSESGRPEWRDADRDGMIIDAGTETDPTEWSVPVAYVRDTRPKVAAKFKVECWSIDQRPTAANLQVTIQGLWLGYGSSLKLPEQTVTVDANGYADYPATETETALANFVDSDERADIEWQFKTTNNTKWTGAGTSGNELFVTLATPLGPSYHTVMSISTRASWGASSMGEVIEKTWRAFEPLNLSTVTPAFRPPLPDPPPVVLPIRQALPLTYYGNWQNGNLVTIDLLRDNDGQCGSWANLFYDTLEQHSAVSGMKIMLVESSKGAKAENFAVAKWDMPGPGGGQNKAYPYRNWYSKTGDLVRVDGNGVWRYQWGDSPAAEANDAKGLEGQGPTANPASLFENHQLVLFAGTYYDPIYGYKYTSLRQFEDTAVAAYVDIRDAKLGFVDFRPNPPTGPYDDPEMVERQVRP